jgi:hypothetical protein
MAKQENDTPETEEEWATHTEETPDQIVFDTVGDYFIGTFTGTNEVTGENKKTGEAVNFTQLLFRGEVAGGKEGPSEHLGGGPYVTNAGYQLRTAFEKIKPGTRVRITFVKTVNVGQPSPMKDFRIDVPRSLAYADKAR